VDHLFLAMNPLDASKAEPEESDEFPPRIDSGKPDCQDGNAQEEDNWSIMANNDYGPFMNIYEDVQHPRNTSESSNSGPWLQVPGYTPIDSLPRSGSPRNLMGKERVQCSKCSKFLMSKSLR
jgi:hypothetical protein